MLTLDQVQKELRPTEIAKFHCVKCGTEFTATVKKGLKTLFSQPVCGVCVKKHNQPLKEIPRRKGDPVYGECGKADCAGFKAKLRTATKTDVLCPACSKGLEIHHSRYRGITSNNYQRL
jgi:hypothetical protein